jgi:heme exporter protein CcmD
MHSLEWLLSTEGHALFVWASYLPALALLAAEGLLVHARLRRARRNAHDVQARELGS